MPRPATAHRTKGLERLTGNLTAATPTASYRTAADLPAADLTALHAVGTFKGEMPISTNNDPL
jgi:hypothetical protein